MTTARFRLELPEGAWIADLSRSFPDATFRLLTGLGLDDGALELGELHADDVSAVVEAFREHPAIREYEQLFVERDRALARYETTDPGLYEFLRQSSFPPEFPIVVRDGSVTFDLTGSRDRIRAVRDALEEGPLDVDVVSILHTEAPADLLTDRQREVVDTAVQRGYYEIPRECTLTDLARILEIDPSTASGVLRRAEARIVAWFLSVGDPGPEGRPR